MCQFYRKPSAKNEDSMWQPTYAEGRGLVTWPRTTRAQATTEAKVDRVENFIFKQGELVGRLAGWGGMKGKRAE